MSENIVKKIYHRPYLANVQTTSLYSAVKGNRNIIQRMKLLKKLPVHNGCVNTISWNDTGEYILSGSDDQRLCISNGYTHKLQSTIRTGHRANIFSAKFLPCSNDEKIVSCSGDGIIMFTNVQHAEELTGNSFNCHFGTAYKIVTVPNDPHSFLSCGEDGTVRWYDLRIKQSCHLEDCQEDILINCRRAVTALAVNPLIPYQLAIGCSDSYVQIFDRRMMGTRATGGGRGSTVPMVRFTAPGFENHAHRITSLVYSARADEVLVSYSSEYLYLFRLQNKQESGDSSGNKEFGHIKKKQNAGPLPMKRLRLRGDWSDTGPNARPERETQETSHRPSLHTSLMQRMSDVLTRMLNDPSRGRSTRNQPPTTTTSEPSVSQEPSTDTSSTIDRPSSSTSSIFTDSEDSRFSEASQQAVPDETLMGEVIKRVTSLTSPEGGGEEVAGAACSATNSATSESFVSVSSSSDSNRCDKQNSTEKTSPMSAAAASASSGNEPVVSTTVESESSQNELLLEAGEPQNVASDEHSVENKDNEERLEDSFVGNEVLQSSVQALGKELQTRRQDFLERHNVEPVINLRYSAQGVSSGVISMGLNHAGETTGDPNLTSTANGKLVGKESEASTSKAGSSTTTQPCDSAQSNLDANYQPADSSAGETNLQPANDDDNDDEVPNSAPEAMVLEESERSEEVSSTSRLAGQVPYVVTIQEESGVSSPGGNVSMGESSGLPDISSDSSSGEEELTRCWFRRTSGLYPPRTELSGELIRNMEETIAGSTGGGDNAIPSDKCYLYLPTPQLLHKFTGHRNARTMIKEANFWGDHFVMSGSDCGHIFFWDRYTGEVVMILEADRHVVNCIQPHPYDPVLASSGIDYDIKLWAPLEEEPNFNRTFASEIILRNDVMLEETRDTITVPASFMIRMLASLNHLRSGARSRLSRSQSSQDD